MEYFNLKILHFSFIFLIGCSRNSEIITAISLVEDRWVPDKREGVFNITSNHVKGNTYILRGETNIAEAKEALVKELNSSGYSIRDSIIILPCNIPSHWGLASLSVINLRTEPSHTAEMSNQALMGTPVKILKEVKGWFYVQTPDKYIAWCEEDVITVLDSNKLASWKQSPRVIVTEPHSFILDSAGVRSISDVVEGCILQKVSETDKLVRVSLPDNREGTLPRNYVVDFNDWSSHVVPDSGSLVEHAQSMVGLPYLWGANSSKAVDCSGFTKTVYFLNGIILSRDASLQVLHGETVQTNNGWQNYQVGDLLFFGRPEHITHVAMYIGNSEYIHSAGLVKINSLDSSKNNYNEYRANSLQAVRRITGSEGTEGIVPIKKHPWYFNNW